MRRWSRRNPWARLGNVLRVRVFYHDKCFDGASSAALFSRFYRERVRSDAEFTFTGLVHRAANDVPHTQGHARRSSIAASVLDFLPPNCQSY